MAKALQAVRRHRFTAALGLAVAYLFCVLAPSAALALGGSAHCLTDVPVAAHVHAAKAKAEPHAHAAATTHRHGDGTVHHHADKGAPPQPATDDHAAGANCCGLFCITAIALDPAVMLPQPPAVLPEAPRLAEEHAGSGPDRINRPPIA
jgi:hypothetical protein